MLDFNLLGGGGLNPLQMATQGYAQGAQLQQAQNLMQQQQQLALQQQQDAEAEQELLNRALGGDVAAKSEFILRKFAKDGKEAQAAFEMMDAPKKQEAKNIATQLYTLSETNPTAARDYVKNRIAAYENTENLTPEQQQDLAYFKTMELVDDEALPFFTGNMAALALGVDDFKKLSGALAERKKQPLEMRKLEADVKTAETGAAYAPTTAALDVQGKRLSNEKTWLENQIKKLEGQGYLTPTQQAELDEKRARIAKINVEIGETQSKKISDISTDIENQRGSVQSAQDVINTAQKLIGHKGFESLFGTSSYLPSIAGGDAADASSLLEQLQSQAFMSSVDKMRGLGALTEMEGKKLSSSIANVKENMSEAAAKQALNEIVTIMTRAKMKAESMIKKQEQKLKPLKQTAAQSTFDELNSKY